ncbi:MAG: DNA polymerase III subunit delta' [Betaproteobacteria bacterium RIFCSPHIGHO2_12_FULL_69_13]|nr:MAG: DNA polymerase III subunit delta' [Betaproteobacteria bacterium RIFCSPHIGHO2_12_FULL_69_13]OGA69654.1 MAG: DNA polymerase III subunit delta' [Betaproteobacteria bacterium RIFCSPLOWO2_12_FULL_68_20]
MTGELHPWNAGVFQSLAMRVPRLPHALLIHGVPGIGKLALAGRFAQSLLCEHPDRSSRPCGSCDACRWFLAGNHPDSRRLEPESIAMQSAPEPEEGAEAPARRARPSVEIKVDEVRGLADFLNLRSHRGGRRIALVHPAEDMNAHAANALLKGLEEPPPEAVFLLVSHRPARLLPTIRSRCVAVPVPVPERAAALRWLESRGVTQAERWLAYSGGAPLRALEYAGASEALAALLRAALEGDAGVLDSIRERDELETLAEALQKHALDRAFESLAGRRKYMTEGKPAAAGTAVAWLEYARSLGRHRVLARHPVNPRLFVLEMLAGLPSRKT